MLGVVLRGVFGILIGAVELYLIYRVARHFINKRRIKREEQDRLEIERYAIDPTDPAVVALIDEAVTVINDMLEVGSSAQVIRRDSDEDYTGYLFFFVKEKGNTCRGICEYGFYIGMFNISELQGCVERFGTPNHPSWYPVLDKAKYFSKKYISYYNHAKKCYEYTTKRSIETHFTHKETLSPLLEQEIKRRCPLADSVFRGGMYTKNVCH